MNQTKTTWYQASEYPSYLMVQVVIVVFVLFDLAYIEIMFLQVLHHQRSQKACFSTLDSVLLYHVGFSCCFSLLHQDGCFDSV